MRMSEAGNLPQIWNLFENIYSFQTDFDLVILGPRSKLACLRQVTIRKYESSLTIYTFFETDVEILILCPRSICACLRQVTTRKYETSSKTYTFSKPISIFVF